MSTRDKVDGILREIGTDASSTDSMKSGKNVNEIVSKLLDRPVNSGVGTQDGLVFSHMQQNAKMEYYKPLQSNRKFIGYWIVLIKRVFRKLLANIFIPAFESQSNFNADTVSMLDDIQKTLGRLNVKTNDFESRIASNTAEIDTNAAEITSIKLETNDYKKAHEQKHDSLELAFFRAVNNTDRKTPAASKTEPLEELAELDYFDLENRFRGSRESVIRGLEHYLHFLKDRRNVVDLGCGRGEFLELLQESKINALGIDISQEFVDYCNFKGLKALHGDAVEYIASLGDDSVDAITGVHIAEHLSSKQLLQLCRLSYKKLINGGMLILETPNPTSLSMFMNAFYVDPTHNKPVHPQYLRYIAEKGGFSKVDIIYTEGSKSGYRLPLLDVPASNVGSFNDGINLLSDVIFGSQDYAIVAVK